MIEYNEKNAKRWAVLGERPVFGITLLELAKNDETIIAVTADTASSAGLDRMSRTLPDQIINVGIAEQNMLGIAAGLSSEGYKVVTATFAPFQSMRCLEQIRVDLGYMKQKVVMAGLASGVAYGELGYTHCCIEDISLMRSIPNIAVICPADCMEVAKALEAALEYGQSVYIRLMDKTGIPIVDTDDYPFHIGKAVQVYGTDNGGEARTAVLANGTMVYPAIQAARQLEETRGINTLVYDMHTVKPLDTDLLDALGKTVDNIITVEEHSLIGGLGSAVAEYYSDKKHRPLIYRMGMKDEYCHGASHETILDHYELTQNGIINKILFLKGE